jgi:hypothetical protein
MALIRFFRYLFLYIWDKVILLLFLFQKENGTRLRLSSGLVYERLADRTDVSENVREIWSSLFDGQLSINELTINKIYDLNFTIFSDSSFKKIDYYIKSHLWSLLDLYEIDTWGFPDQNVFTPPKLITYAIFEKDGGIILLLVTLEKKKFTLLRSYDINNIPLWKFKRKGLVYDKKDGFLSI